MKRKRFSEKQIIRILKEAEQEHRTISEVCPEHRAWENTFYRWRQKFAGRGCSGSMAKECRSGARAP